MLLVQNSLILIPEVIGWSECSQLFASFAVVVSGILVFGVVSGNPEIGNEFCGYK